MAHNGCTQASLHDCTQKGCWLLVCDDTPGRSMSSATSNRHLLCVQVVVGVLAAADYKTGQEPVHDPAVFVTRPPTLRWLSAAGLCVWGGAATGCVCWESVLTVVVDKRPAIIVCVQFVARMPEFRTCTEPSAVFVRYLAPSLEVEYLTNAAGVCVCGGRGRGLRLACLAGTACRAGGLSCICQKGCSVSVLYFADGNVLCCSQKTVSIAP